MTRAPRPSPLRDGPPCNLISLSRRRHSEGRAPRLRCAAPARRARLRCYSRGPLPRLFSNSRHIDRWMCFGSRLRAPGRRADRIRAYTHAPPPPSPSPALRRSPSRFFPPCGDDPGWCRAQPSKLWAVNSGSRSIRPSPRDPQLGRALARTQAPLSFLAEMTPAGAGRSLQSCGPLTAAAVRFGLHRELSLDV